MMDNMKCWDCAMKHLACALSYGKEILSGHTRGAALDHRPDLLGELANCEHHAELLDPVLFHVLSGLRKQLQAKRGMVDFNDLEQLRGLYLKVEELSEASEDQAKKEIWQSALPTEAGRFGGPRADAVRHPGVESLTEVEYPVYEHPLDIVFERVDKPAFFACALDSIRKHLKKFGKIYVLSGDPAECTDPDVEFVGLPLIDLLKTGKVSADFLWWRENMALLREFDARHAFPAFSPRSDRAMVDTMRWLRERQYRGMVYLWDGLRPQPVNTELYLKWLDGVTTEYPLTVYFSLKNEEKLFQVRNSCCMVDRPICCSMRTQLRQVPFVTWGDEVAFASLLKFLNQ